MKAFTIVNSAGHYLMDIPCDVDFTNNFENARLFTKSDHCAYLMFEYDLDEDDGYKIKTFYLSEKEPVLEKEGPTQYFVYFIKEKKLTHGNWKIGFTTDLKKRLAALQTGHPEKLGYEGFFIVSDKESAMKLEKELHEMFKKVRMQGEWFRGDDQTILNIYFKINKWHKEQTNPWGHEFIRYIS